MSTRASRPHRFVGAVLLGLLVLGGCATAAAPPATQGPLATLDPRELQPTAPPTPRRATPLPTARPTPSPTATPEPDLAAELRIGAPYELVANPRNKALTASFTIDFGGEHIEAVMHGREIHRNGTPVGLALVMEMRGVPMNAEAFDAAVKTTGRATAATILGHRVAFVTTAQTLVGMYELNGTIVMVGGTKAADTKALLTSVIKAN